MALPIDPIWSVTFKIPSTTMDLVYVSRAQSSLPRGMGHSGIFGFFFPITYSQRCVMICCSSDSPWLVIYWYGKTWIDFGTEESLTIGMFEICAVVCDKYTSIGFGMTVLPGHDIYQHARRPSWNQELTSKEIRIDVLYAQNPLP